MIRTGRRLRTDVRDQGGKITITINAQMQAEDQLTSLRAKMSDELSELQESRREIDQRLDDLTAAVNDLRQRG